MHYARTHEGTGHLPDLQRKHSGLLVTLSAKKEVPPLPFQKNSYYKINQNRQKFINLQQVKTSLKEAFLSKFSAFLHLLGLKVPKMTQNVSIFFLPCWKKTSSRTLSPEKGQPPHALFVSP
jgi:hypothetical protein